MAKRSKPADAAQDPNTGGETVPQPKRMGRPRVFGARTRVELSLPAEILGAIDLLVADLRAQGVRLEGAYPTRIALITAILRANPQVEAAVARWQEGERAP